MAYTINLDKNLKVIRYKVTGTIDKDNLGKGMIEVISLDEFKNLGFRVLADYRDVKFNFSLNDTNIIDPIIYDSLENLSGKKAAVIVKEPYNTAISVIIKEKFDVRLEASIKIFYTEEAALKWLANLP